MMAKDEKNANNSDSKPNKPLWESPVLRVAALITALTIIANQINNLLASTKSITPEFYTIILSGLNATILLSYCLIATRTPKLEFSNEIGKEEYSKLFDFIDDNINIEESKKIVEKNNQRVNLLAEQLNKNILYFSLLLSITYILYIFDKPDDVNIHNVFKIGEDITNFLSSVFLYLAFKVLYDKTLEDDNSEYNYYMDAIIVSGVYIISYIFFAIVKLNVEEKSISAITNLFSLLSGLFNGLAMTLLFSRYISMEHSVSNIQEVKYNDLISMLTIFLLPLYTLAQPLFGTFEIDAFGEPEEFKNYVFLICLLGKIFFLFMTYYFLKRRLLHLYMHIVLTRDASGNKIADCFKL